MQVPLCLLMPPKTGFLDSSIASLPPSSLLSSSSFPLLNLRCPVHVNAHWMHSAFTSGRKTFPLTHTHTQTHTQRKNTGSFSLWNFTVQIQFFVAAAAAASLVCVRTLTTTSTTSEQARETAKLDGDLSANGRRNIRQIWLALAK